MIDRSHYARSTKSLLNYFALFTSSSWTLVKSCRHIITGSTSPPMYIRSYAYGAVVARRCCECSARLHCTRSPIYVEKRSSTLDVNEMIMFALKVRITSRSLFDCGKFRVDATKVGVGGESTLMPTTRATQDQSGTIKVFVRTFFLAKTALSRTGATFSNKPTARFSTDHGTRYSVLEASVTRAKTQIEPMLLVYTT